MMRRLINFWPPLLFAGIRVRRIAPDWRRVDVELRLRWWNRNAVGTMFGGSLFAMTDPFHVLMLQHSLGTGYTVWVRSAQIEFISPGRTVALAVFELNEDTVAEIRRATEDGQKCEPVFAVAVNDPEGNAIATVNLRLYVRRKRAKG